MAGNAITLKMWLVSLISSLPVIAVLIAGLVTCWMQRARRPRVSGVLAAVMGFQLVMALGLWIVFRQLVMFVQSLLADSMPNDGWMRPLSYLLPYSCLAAVVWGVAFSAVLFLNDNTDDLILDDEADE